MPSLFGKIKWQLDVFELIALVVSKYSANI